MANVINNHQGTGATIPATNLNFGEMCLYTEVLCIRVVAADPEAYAELRVIQTGAKVDAFPTTNVVPVTTVTQII